MVEQSWVCCLPAVRGTADHEELWGISVRGYQEVLIIRFGLTFNLGKFQGSVVFLLSGCYQKIRSFIIGYVNNLHLGGKRKRAFDKEATVAHISW